MLVDYDGAVSVQGTRVDFSRKLRIGNLIHTIYFSPSHLSIRSINILMSIEGSLTHHLDIRFTRGKAGLGVERQPLAKAARTND
jgi:hypothetical protein